MKNSTLGLTVVAAIGLCLNTSSTVKATDVWESQLYPVYEDDDAGGHVTVVNDSDFGGSQIIVVAHGLLPNTEYRVRVSHTLPVYSAQISTNQAGILTLHDAFGWNATSYAEIREPDGAGEWILRLLTP